METTEPSPRVQSKGAVTSEQPTMPVTIVGSPSGSVSLSRTPLPEGVVSETFGVRPPGRSTRSSVLPNVSHESLPAVGPSLTAVTVMVNCTDAEVSTPPLAVPPLSERNTVTVAEPKAFGAGVNVSVPLALIEGPLAKSDGLLFETMLNVSVCDDSLAGPALIAVAHDAL